MAASSANASKKQGKTPPRDLAGKRLGRYTLGKHLDTGGMAEIYLARHEALAGFRKDLVIKMLQPRYEQQPEVLAMFLDEARLAAKLNHPSICEVFDVGEDEGTHFIAMEYIEGKTLTDLVRRGIEVGKPVPLPYAAHIISQVADGLGYMYEGRDPEGNRFGIVHRDISPTNIIISATGQSRIIDFGIATDKAASKDEDTGRPGKYSYMSPEQVRGVRVDGRSDIFSLGIILYEITLGRRLFRGPAQVVMKRIVEEDIRPPTFLARDFPPALEIIILRALEKDPDDRYQSANELCRDLEAFLAESGSRVSNHQIARYLETVERPDAPVSDKGARRARAFIEGDDEIEQDEELDLDFKARQEWRNGPAAEETGPRPAPGPREKPAEQAPVAAESVPGSIVAVAQAAVPSAGAAPVENKGADANKEPTAEPRRWPGGVTLAAGIALGAAAAWLLGRVLAGQ